MSIRDLMFGVKTKIQPVNLEDVGQVYVRDISSADFDELRAGIQAKTGGISQRGMVAWFVIAGVCDENGNAAFSLDDFEQVNALPSRVMMPLFRAIQDLNNIGNDDTDELVGNSDGTTPSDSGTD